MAAEVKKEIALEIAHVLFIDIVAYSRMATDDQRAAIDELNQIVQSTDEYRQAQSENRLLKLATGDGMALIFYHSPEDPVECALEISRAIKEQHSNLRVRMGVHSGPVSGVVDVNGRTNVAGAGINMGDGLRRRRPHSALQAGCRRPRAIQTLAATSPSAWRIRDQTRRKNRNRESFHN